jgi:hypothetical protein
MLVAFLIIVYLLLILFAYGQGAVLLLQKKSPTKSNLNLPFILIIGLMAVTTLASFASLLIRINWEFQVFLVVGAALIYIFVIVRGQHFPKISFKSFNLAQKLGLIFMAACLIITLYQATLTPANADTGIYHAQAIHWIESYSAVPGLANLHQRLGYDSSWLLGNAVFSLAFLNFQSFHLLTGAFFLIMLVYFYQGIHELLAKKYQLSNFLRLGFFLSIFIFLFDQVSSPGTDAPTTLLLWFLITQVIVLLEAKQPLSGNVEALALFLLGFYCVTIKVSSAPVLLLALGWWILLLVKKLPRKAWSSALLALIVVLPFILRNLIQTGYPVFPGFPVNLFHFDWTYPLDGVKQESVVIHWFAMLSNVPLKAFLKMSYQSQVSNWYINQLPRHKAILFFIPGALGFNLLLCAFRSWRKLLKENLAFILVYFTTLAGCVFWFVSAPAFRFGYGFLLAAVFLLAFPVIAFIIQRVSWIQRFAGPVILIGCIALTAITLRSSIKVDQISETLVMPADYPTWSSEPCEFGNFKLLCQAAYDSCWYSPFPCAVRGDSEVEMRGNDFQDGFRYGSKN